ncbi:MAG: CBS domain-containing protein [Myxococcales bacterium]|nr:CBS domain-containing protein [Myxococcales bacterium]
MQNSRTILSYFTVGTHAVEAHQPVATAMEVMQKHDLRHLPVLQDGVVVGEVSERGLRVWQLQQEFKFEPAISHIMVEDPYIVDPGAPLKEVATEMAARKIGCAIVVSSGRLSGMFTVTDALRACPPPRVG